MNNVDKEYFRLLQTILDNGRVKHNRTGTDTIGVFGEQAKFKVSFNEFPILTTKRVYFRAIVHELLWFIKGDTNIKYLVDNDVHIWDEWAYKRYIEDHNKKFLRNGIMEVCPMDMKLFIERIKFDDTFAEKWGELGEGTYGGMWRAFPYAQTMNQEDEDHDINLRKVDQLKKVMDKLKTNPDDRRMIVSAWHPYWVDHCALPPCHCLFHFNTEELTAEERLQLSDGKVKGSGMSNEEAWNYYDKMNVPKRRLNLMLTQRSNDVALGTPFNVSSYSLLLAMVAQCVNMVPGTFTHSMGDLHLYINHLDGIKEQMKREPKILPKLWLNPKIKNLFDFKYEDVKLIDYDPHPTIKFDVAV